jgi:DNA-binding XRE family transcriptional regulator
MRRVETSKPIYMKTLRQQLAEAQAEVARLRKAARCKREPLRGEIGGIIQQIRESKEITLREMAKRSGVAAGLASRVEAKSDANPNWNTLVKLAAALETPLSEIVARWEAEKANVKTQERAAMDADSSTD